MISKPWGRVGVPHGTPWEGCLFFVGWAVHVWRALVFVCSRVSDWDHESRRVNNKRGRVEE
eukprot:1868188-Prymnesium_polylepis.1